MQRYRLVAALVLSVLVGGCATYVNIPGQPGDVAVHDPNAPTVSEAVAEGLRAAVADRPSGRRFQVVLFDGVDAQVARSIMPKVSRHAVWVGDVDEPGLPVVSVRRLLIRDRNAQVDVTRPARPAHPQSGDELVTAYLKWDLASGWLATQTRAWRTDPEAALRQASEPYREKGTAGAGSAGVSEEIETGVGDVEAGEVDEPPVEEPVQEGGGSTGPAVPSSAVTEIVP